MKLRRYPIFLVLSLLAVAAAACDKKVGASASPSAGQQVFVDANAAQVADAISANDAASVRRLLEAGANSNAVGEKGTSLLRWAIVKNSSASFEALLSGGADPAWSDVSGATVVHEAARNEDTTYLKMLLAHRIRPDIANPISGETPLMVAISNHVEVEFQALLAAGANPNLADRMGNTPLHVAGEVNASSLALELLQAGADPRAVNRQGVTFVRYLDMTPDNVLTDDARSQREAVHTWLSVHQVAAEGR